MTQMQDYHWSNSNLEICQICHQSDKYNIETKHCYRCASEVNQRFYNLSYSLSYRDIITFGVMHTNTQPFFIIINAILYLLLVLASLPESIHLPLYYFLPPLIFKSIFFAVILLGAHTLINMMVCLPSKNKTLLTNYRIHISDNSIIEESPYIKTEIAWYAIQKIKCYKNYLCIYYAQHSLILIPIKKCNSANNLDEIHNFIETRWRANSHR